MKVDVWYIHDYIDCELSLSLVLHSSGVVLVFSGQQSLCASLYLLCSFLPNVHEMLNRIEVPLG